MAVKLTLAAALLAGSDAFSIHAPAQRSTRAPVALPAMVATPPAKSPLASDFWSKHPSVKVQGGTLKTWDIGSESIERVQLSIKSDGRPVNTNIELWHTPAYIPTKFRVYTEDGKARPINAVIETPKHPKTVAVYNTGAMEFPFEAGVAETGLAKAYESLAGEEYEHVQGGRITSYTFGPEVESVQILLKTVERNMKAKIELTQGPNQVKQFVELYASSGYKNPFYMVIPTPGAVNTIRVINQNTVEFPFDAWVVPYETDADSGTVAVMGGF